MPLEILMQKYLHETGSEIFSGKINELLMETRLVICFYKGSIPTKHRVCLDTKATLTRVSIFIPIHADKKARVIIFT